MMLRILEILNPHTISISLTPVSLPIKAEKTLLRSPVIQISMAEFTADLQSFRPSFPLLDIDPNVENLSVLTTSDMDFQSFMSFSNEKFFGYHPQAPEFTANMVENIPGSVHQFNQNVVPVADQPTNVAAGNEFHESRKRKSMDDKPENSSGTSSPPVSETGSTKRKNVMICYV